MKNIKKIVVAGKGYSIFITKEAKELGWDETTNIILETDKTKKTVILKEI